MTEMDAVCAGLAGGFLGAIAVIWNYYWYITAKTKQYNKAKRFTKQTLKLVSLEDKLKNMEQTVSAMQEEINKPTRIKHDKTSRR